MVTVKGGVGRERAVLESPDLGEFMHSDYPFVIPDFQRPYEWGAEEIQDYIGDLNGLYELVTTPRRQSVEPYFFGAIITHEERIGRRSRERVLHIIDGQQRLTTFYLTVAAIRRHFTSLSKEAISKRLASEATTDAADLEELLYITGKPGELWSQRELRLIPQGADRNFYRDLVEHGHLFHALTRRDPASHILLQKASAAIDEELISKVVDESATAAARLDSLRALRDCLLSYSYVIHAGTDTEDEAYRLFFVLNDRGKPLSEADLLRTKTFELLRDHPSLKKRAEAAWHPITNGRNRESAGKFLRAFYAMRVGKRPDSKDLHKQYLTPPVKAGILEPLLNPKKPRNSDEAEPVAVFAEDLRDAWDRYLTILEGKWPYENPKTDEWTRQRLHRLVVDVGQTAAIPILMALSFGPEVRFADALLFLERFGLRYIISDGHASSLADAYFFEAKRLYDDRYKAALDADDLETALAPLAATDAPDARFFVSLAGLGYERGRRAILLKHLFTTIDDYLGWVESGAAGRPRPSTHRQWDLKRGDVDHLYAQNPTPSSKNADLEQLKHTLGNLTFLESRPNRAARNRPFDWKQEHIYSKKNQTVLTQRLAEAAEFPVWDKAHCEKRQRELLAITAKIFAVKGA